MLLRIEDPWSTIKWNAPIRRLPFSVDKGHIYLWLTVMALELNWLHQNFDAAHTQHCATQTNKFVDQMWLDLGEWVHRIVVEKSYHYKSLVLLLAKHIQSDRVEGQCHGPCDIRWMVPDELKKLLHICRRALIQLSVINLNYNLLKIILFLLPT